MSDEVEKAWEVYGKSEGLVYNMPNSSERRAFMAGRASRDAEVVDAWQHADEGAEYTIRSLRQQLAEREALVESQGRQIAALTGSVQDISTGLDKTLDQLAEREAVIERARAAWFGPCAFDLKQHGPAVTAAIAAASPSVVLADLIREKQAEALKGAADAIDRYLVRPVGANTTEQQYFRPWHAEWLRARAAEYRQAVSR